ncbi:hypothetical protein [Nocardia sp. CA-145437]|uniref:hypothetical protein n=1 Tax=Nocardia sp. CA-145437 TaxID=3239980 RepID=UPI003D99DA67
MQFDTAKMRQLATDQRTAAEAIAKLAEGGAEGRSGVAINDRESARTKMPHCDLATRTEESLKAMDRVLALHAKRLREFADATDGAANAIDKTEAINADAFKAIK